MCIQLLFQHEVEKCEYIFHITFNATDGASIYKYQVNVWLELLPILHVKRLIANGRGQLTITGTKF